MMITVTHTQKLLLQLIDLFYPKLNQTCLIQLKEVYKCIEELPFLTL